MNFANLLIGIGFGFLLSRAGATHFDYYAQLFLFQNLQLLWVILTAVAIGVPGIILLKKTQTNSLLTGGPIQFEDRKMQKGLVTGALIFGVGWGLTGSCPGSVLAMIGEGKMAVMPTFIGMLAGTYFYAWFKSRRVNIAGSQIATSPRS
jgi:uncharacterized membrane protein YedE/YeeE